MVAQDFLEFTGTSLARRGGAGLDAADIREFAGTAARAVGRSDRNSDCQQPKSRGDRRLADSAQHPDPSSAASEHGGLPLTATGNLTRAVVAEMCKLIEWPDFDQADTFRFNKVINEPDFLPLHVVRQLAQAATLVRAQRGKLVAMPLGKSLLSEAGQGSLLAPLFHLAFWHMDLSYFGRGLLGSWPQADAGVVLWSLSACADDWQSAEKLTRLCTIPEPAMLSGTWDQTRYAMEARILRPLLWFGLLEHRTEKIQIVQSVSTIFIERRSCSIDCSPSQSK